MFYTAEALLLHLDQTYSSHAAVISAFGREFAKTGAIDPKYHRYLISAQDFRNIGDYGVEVHVTEGQASLSCSWAEDFIMVAKESLALP